MNKPINQSGTWKSRPVFISSTFKDMHAERDWLRNRVFPRLGEELRKRHHHLELIDLRLGVETAQADTEEARELLVLKVCLDEIKRSRPFLLVVLGDRYGWVPPEDRIATAAREQGFKTSPTGKSVTALEIEFGLLKEDPAQKQRSLFFFRQPLPYDQMTKAQREIYSDAHSPDSKVRAGHSKLVELKNKLRNDPELGPRVFDYRLGWDAAAGKVTGLEAFEKLVFDKLWAVIDEETRADAAQVPPTWEEQERSAIAEFVEHRSRIVVGRKEVIDQLLQIARLPAVEGPIGSVIWGACVTGSPGSGKSAVFAKLYRELDTNDRGILLLTNVAGGTQRGASVDAMLRRWIVELSATSRTANPLPEKATPDDVEAAFYSLLRQVSAQCRVVVLLDALDQFEPTPRGRHLTWFKQPQWPSNARIIATGLLCPAGEVLSQWAGIEEVELPQLTAADAARIGEQVWGLYHREINPAVLRVLVGKKLPDGKPACGNPLWLTLALEQLNLLDADDFARAERDFTGSPVERMAALLLDTAKRMPPDISGLYGWLLEQNEKAFGSASTRGFAVAIALSRSGWRETDLLVLVPRLAQILTPSSVSIHPSPFDDLSLAALRRGFRAHIVRRGENGQLDFFHAQMRRAILERCATKEADRRKLHEQIVDHLESLPEEDPLRINEAMFHLLGLGDASRAAAYLASVQPFRLYSASKQKGDAAAATLFLLAKNEIERPFTKVALNAAVAALVEELHFSPKTDQDQWIDWIACLTSGNDHARAGNIAYIIMNSIVNALAADGTTQSKHLCYRLLLIARDVFEQLVAVNPSNQSWQHNLSEVCTKIGDYSLDQNDFDGAYNAYQKTLAIVKHQALRNPTDASWQFDQSWNHVKSGDMLLIKSNPTEALNEYRDALAPIECMLAKDPSNNEWRLGVSIIYNKIGDALLHLNVPAEALKAYQEALFHRVYLTGFCSVTSEGQRALSVCHEKIGDALNLMGNLDEAFKAYLESLAVDEQLVASDPSNSSWQLNFSVINIKIGDVLRDQGNIGDALRAYRKALSVVERLAQNDPDKINLHCNLIANYQRIGDLMHIQGNLDDAKEWWRKAYTQLFSMKQREIMPPTYERFLSVLKEKAGL